MPTHRFSLFGWVFPSIPEKSRNLKQIFFFCIFETNFSWNRFFYFESIFLEDFWRKWRKCSKIMLGISRLKKKWGEKNVRENVCEKCLQKFVREKFQTKNLVLEHFFVPFFALKKVLFFTFCSSFFVLHFSFFKIPLKVSILLKHVFSARKTFP